MSKINLKAMSRKELTDYIKANRNDDEKVRSAIDESISRPGWKSVSADTLVEEALKGAIDGKG